MSGYALPLADFWPGAFNTGGPVRPLRKQRLSGSLLFDKRNQAGLRERFRAGLYFPAGDPLEISYAMLAEAGLEDPEALKSWLNATRDWQLPREPCLVCAISESAESRKPVADLSLPEFLWSAAVLGLSTDHAYDPARPVIWTRNRLSRLIAAYDAGSFYA